MFCPNCGKQVPDDSAFCTSCGSSLTQAAPATPPAAPSGPTGPDPYQDLARRYADVATDEDLAAFHDAQLKLLGTFYSLPFLSFTAMIMVVSLLNNSNTFWLDYPELGYFFAFVAVVLFVLSIYVPYLRGRAGALRLFVGARYRAALTARYMAAKAILRSGDRSGVSPSATEVKGGGEFADMAERFPGTVSKHDLLGLLKGKLGAVVTTLQWLFFGTWVLVVVYWEIWMWVGSGPAGYLLGLLVAILFLALYASSIAAFDGDFVDDLRRLRTPSQRQAMIFEDYLEAKRLTKTR